MTAVASVHAQHSVRRDLGTRVDLSSGYDSNPTLALDPNARRDPTLPVAGPGPGAVVQASGNSYAVFGSLPWLGAALSTDARIYHSFDARHDTAVSLLAGTELGIARLSLAVVGGRYDASFGSDNAWYGSFSPTFRLSFSERVSLGLEGHADFRSYAQAGQTNGDLGAAVELQLRQDTWLASLGVDVDRRESSDATAARAQVTPFASLALVIDAWSLSVRYAAFARSFDVAGQNGVEHTAELITRYRLGSLVSLSARIGAGIARGQVDALSYDRVYALAGLSFTLGSDASHVAVGPDRSQQGGARLDASTTRFAVCAVGARDVAVVGTFNGWSAQAGRMQPTTDGCHAIDVVVPAGHHRYQWMIDGELARPDGAPAYAPDGFGGEDAVLIVPE
jgi:hypothetical protein